MLSSWPTLIGKSKSFLPKQSTFFELLGFVVLAVGIFCGLALLTYDPSDLTQVAATGETYQNMGGPGGARLADLLLGTLGIGSLLIAPMLCLCGALMALGFIRWPKAKRFAGFGLILVVFAGFTHVEQPNPDATNLPHGVGGVIGTLLGNALLKGIGYGGAVIGLAFAAVASLVITGNLTVYNTAKFAEYLLFLLRRLASQSTGENSKRRPASLTNPGKSETPAQANGENSKRTAQSGQSDENETDISLDLTSTAPRNGKPDLDMFQTSKVDSVKKSDFSALVQQLEGQLREFKIEGKISNVTQGPVVTTLEYEPGAGMKAAKIVSIANDIARMLRAESVRVIPALPGKSTVGIEIPSEQRSIVRFGDVVKSARFRADELILPVALGVDTFGHPVIEDLAQMPHLLLAGTTGSGKSVFINDLIAGLVCKNSAKEMRFVFIDPKMVELAAYKKLPHLACPVISDVKTQARAVLHRLVAEMENRYEMMLALEARNIQEFNETIRTRRRSEFVTFSGKWHPLPYVVFLIDEFADLILILGKPAEELITRLAQKARAAGIHLVIATQRPSVNVVTGLIKANFPTRIAFRVQSGVDSRTILDAIGAETLLGKGDLLYQSAGRIQRLHAALLEDNEVRKLVRACA